MKGFKTVAFGVVLAALSILSNEEMRAFVAGYMPEIGSSIGAMIIFLRWLTTSPIFKKDQ